MGLKARILAVDDQLYSRSFLEGVLAEAGYGVATADSAAAAIASLERGPRFDLVLLDLVMPEMDGVETARQLRERWPDLPVVVMTGVGDVRSALAAMKLGATDYMLKPIEREELLRAVGAVLNQRVIQHENARLVDENLAIMGLLSVYERALPLLASRQRRTLASDWLELLCAETRAAGGVVWLSDAAAGALLRCAACGEGALRDAPASFGPVPDEPMQLLLAGQPVEAAGPGASSLLVPGVRHGELLVVARLDARPEGWRPASVAVARKLGELVGFALENATRAEALERESLADPQTELPRRIFLERVLVTEIEKAQRFARRLALLRVELSGPDDPPVPRDRLGPVIEAIRATLRATDTLAIEGDRLFWVLLSDADPLGSAALKRRVGRCVREALGEVAPGARAWLGTGSFPADGASFEALADVATSRAAAARTSELTALDLDERTRLADLAARLLRRGSPMPPHFVAEMADLLAGELSARPKDRGMLFLAPGGERPSWLGPLAELGTLDTATEVFVTAASETLPQVPCLHPMILPDDLPVEVAWIVRFGEAPPYALVAGPPERDGRRNVFHTGDRALVEELAFRLRDATGLEAEA